MGGAPATGSYRNAFRYFDLVSARSSDGEVGDTIEAEEELLAYGVIWAGVWQAIDRSSHSKRCRFGQRCRPAVMLAVQVLRCLATNWR